MRTFCSILVLVLMTTAAYGGSVLPGIDVLIADNFKPLAGKKVGLVTNPTGVTRDLRTTVDVLHDAKEVELVALYGPEHGVRGDIYAGDHIDDTRDPKTGVPVYSLYGKNRKPTAKMLEGVEVLVYDIQDIGSRSYTFISTMAVAMEAAAEQGIRFVVLDRPNPVSGDRIEGQVLDMNFQSFVGQLPVTYVHGLTVGELARMINGEGWLKGGIKCDLHVVPMKGWKRAMYFVDTGLHWVPSSPQVPHADTAMFYAATGIMGELRVVSEGVGYMLPFELMGAPYIDAAAFAEDLNGRNLPGVHFRPMYYKPYFASYKDETCGGVQIHILDRSAVRLTEIQFHAMDYVRKHHPDHALFGGKRDNMFDKVCGRDEIRKAFLSGKTVDEILAIWNHGVQDFRKQRAKYLLYH